MQCETRLWFCDAENNSVEALKVIVATTEGEQLLVETDAFPVRGSEAARAMYAFSPAGENAMFYKSMRSLISSKIGSGLHYKLSDLAPVGGWPVVDKKHDKYEGLTADEKEIMQKADEIQQKIKAAKAAKKACVEKSTSGEEIEVVKTATQRKKDRAAKKAAASALDKAFMEGDATREMSSKTAELNEIARKIGSGWTAEKVSAE